MRLYRNIATYEAAVYFYDGFWKNPDGFDPASNIILFPKLRVTGGTIRCPLGKSIGNIENGYIGGKLLRFHYFCLDLPHSDSCFVIDGATIDLVRQHQDCYPSENNAYWLWQSLISQPS